MLKCMQALPEIWTLIKQGGHISQDQRHKGRGQFSDLSLELETRFVGGRKLLLHGLLWHTGREVTNTSTQTKASAQSSSRGHVHSRHRHLQRGHSQDFPTEQLQEHQAQTSRFASFVLCLQAELTLSEPATYSIMMYVQSCDPPPWRHVVQSQTRQILWEKWQNSLLVVEGSFAMTPIWWMDIW